MSAWENIHRPTQLVEIEGEPFKVFEDSPPLQDPRNVNFWRLKIQLNSGGLAEVPLIGKHITQLMDLRMKKVRYFAFVKDDKTGYYDIAAAEVDESASK